MAEGPQDMISEKNLSIIVSRAREFDAGKIWLFGSCLKNESSANDFDLAVEDIDPGKFFAFYARLIFDLPKPVDLIDLSLDPPIRHIVRGEGVLIYERAV